MSKTLRGIVPHATFPPHWASSRLRRLARLAFLRAPPSASLRLDSECFPCSYSWWYVLMLLLCLDAPDNQTAGRCPPCHLSDRVPTFSQRLCGLLNRCFLDAFELYVDSLPFCSGLFVFNRIILTSLGCFCSVKMALFTSWLFRANCGSQHNLIILKPSLK